MDESLIEMYLAEVSVRRVADITEALWGSKVLTSIIFCELNKKSYIYIVDWRNCPLHDGRYPYVYVDGIYLCVSWEWGCSIPREFMNVAILAAIVVNEDGYLKGAAEGMKEDKAGWRSFFQWLCGCDLDGVSHASRHVGAA